MKSYKIYFLLFLAMLIIVAIKAAIPQHPAGAAVKVGDAIYHSPNNICTLYYLYISIIYIKYINIF